MDSDPRDNADAAVTAAAGTPQLPLALRTLPDYRLDTFVAPPPGASEQLHALATGALSDPVLVTGASGTGKTHLALAVSALAQEHQRQVFYLEPGHVGTRLRAMLEGAEAYPLIVIDGVQAVAGERELETTLFDLHNRVRAAGGGLLYVGSATPDALPLVLPDLRSRLGQCIRISLHALDDEHRTEVLRQRAQRRGMTIDPAAIDWLLARVGRNLGELTGVLDRLDRASLAAQRRITLPFLRQVLQ